MDSKAAVLKWRAKHPDHYRQIQVRWKQGNPDKVRWYMAKANAKRAEHEWLLSLEIYTALVKLPCFYCHNMLGNVQKERTGIGLDRLDNSKGYEPTNIVTCCGFCNTTRGARLSKDEMTQVAQLLVRLRHDK